jgi:hypothetical protein
MEIILSKQCESLTGSLGRGFGYHIQKRKNGYFAKRNSKGVVPPDGHWRFILTCAVLAQNKLHIVDIRVARNELGLALYDAHCYIAMQHLGKDTYDARDIINLKTTFGL